MKADIRRYIRSRKAEFTPEELKEQSTAIIDRLMADSRFAEARTVLLYHSLPDEVYTHKLISEAVKTKTVLLPTVVGDELELHVYTPSTSTHTGVYDICESDGPLFTDYENIDLAVIPGMAFDHKGNRIGRGKGYYDRLLTKLHCPLIGICFPFQYLEKIPVEEHDRKVDAVIAPLPPKGEKPSGRHVNC